MNKVLFFCVLTFMSSVHAEKWDKYNNPRYFSKIIKKNLVTSFADLPLQAHLVDDRYGWSETYWPSNLGGIAYRWNHPDPKPFRYKFYHKEELKVMSEEELSWLSPAELYDIAMGDYKYSLTKKVLKKYSSQDLWWEGICDGWSLASSHYPEPDVNVITNKDGIKVTFGSSDVKGLMSMHDAFNSKGLYARVGRKCNVRGKVQDEASIQDGNIGFPQENYAKKPECADVNAGAFHVVIASMIGLNSKGFVADVDRFNDVWNQPITGYESTVIGNVVLTPMDRENNIYQKIHLKTKMIYSEELNFFDPVLKEMVGIVSKNPVTGTSSQLFDFKDYDYILELNKDGEITGGEWLSETRPDILWMKLKDEKFNSSVLPLEGLNQIYRPVTR
jgi:hypothetical protein